MKRKTYADYPPELRKFVLRQYSNGVPVKRIFADVMSRWPDCGMRTSQSISMMVGANSKNGHKVLRKAPEDREAIPENKTPSISLAGPKWSRQTAR